MSSFGGFGGSPFGGGQSFPRMGYGGGQMRFPRMNYGGSPFGNRMRFPEMGGFGGPRMLNRMSGPQLGFGGMGGNPFMSFLGGGQGGGSSFMNQRNFGGGFERGGNPFMNRMSFGPDSGGFERGDPSGSGGPFGLGMIRNRMSIGEGFEAGSGEEFEGQQGGFDSSF